MPDELIDIFRSPLVFNGINAITGDYGQHPMTAETLAQLIRGRPTPEHYRAFVEHQKQIGALAHVENRLQRITEVEEAERERAKRIRLEELRFKAQSQARWPVKPGAGNPSRIQDVGWAMVFSAAMDLALQTQIKEALQPLLGLRQEQAGDLFRIYEGDSAYRPGERKDQFLQRLQVSAGLTDPQEMPFYVLLIGTPEEIPYLVQYQLDVMRAVGRLDLGTDLQAYRAYAESVVAAERGQVAVPRRLSFFAPINPGDQATQMSAQYLVQPLYENLVAATPGNEMHLTYPWEVMPPLVGDGQATRSRLEQLLSGDPNQTPGLLFAASHGMEFPANHPNQLPHQGALLCQDWAGPGADVRRDHYFAAEDVSTQSNLRGRIMLFFACYGAGTPQLDQFAAQAFKVREKIAPRAFTAALPQSLLRQGTLAVIGHVERAWGYSFISPAGRLENQMFVTAMRSLMNGEPVGVATDASFNMRYAELSSDLSSDLEELNWDPNYMSDYELAHRWTANNDARSYVVIGDPAVRMPLATVTPSSQKTSDFGVIGTPERQTPETVVPPPLPHVALQTEKEDAAATPEPEIKARDTEPAGTATETVTPEDKETAASAEQRAPAPRVSLRRAKLTPKVAPASRIAPQPETAPELEMRPTPEMAAVDLGLDDQFNHLRDALRDFTDQLATSLARAAEDIVTLDIRTYMVEDLAAFSSAFQAGEEVDAQLRALTRVDFDGDLKVFMSAKGEGHTEEILWAVHKAMVGEAQHNRARFLATMAELATNLLNSLRAKS